MTPPPAAGARGIVFDLDGTLIDSYDAIAGSLNHALAALGRAPVPAGRVRAMVGRGVETLLARALGPDAGERPELVAEGVRLFRERYDATCVAGTRLLPGVARTLLELRRRGYRMGVATNKPVVSAGRILEGVGAAALLDAVVGPEQVSRLKPDPEMVRAVLARVGVPADRAIYVGDMPVDVETARAAGLPVYVVPTGSSSVEELRAAGPDGLLPEFAALLDLLPGALLRSPAS